MDDSNYIFFEAFKQLDKLCTELYKTPHGVTHYIDDMKAASWDNYKDIPNWKTDLKELIRLRHIRNHLAHTQGAFHEDICTQNDIDWIKNFYQRIMNQSDPLALLYQTTHRKQHTQKPDYNNYTLNKNIYKNNKDKPNTTYLILTLIIVVTAIILIFYFILTEL